MTALPPAAIAAAVEAVRRANHTMPADLPDHAVYRLIAVAALTAALPHLKETR